MNLLRFAGAIVYHFFAAMHVLRVCAHAREATGMVKCRSCLLRAAGEMRRGRRQGMVAASAGAGCLSRLFGLAPYFQKEISCQNCHCQTGVCFEIIQNSEEGG